VSSEEGSGGEGERWVVWGRGKRREEGGGGRMGGEGVGRNGVGLGGVGEGMLGGMG
jgi:hypothetical protein